jgi:hypothetical protein
MTTLRKDPATSPPTVASATGMVPREGRRRVGG